MSGREAILGRWKSMVGDTSPEPWNAENMAGFLQRATPS